MEPATAAVLATIRDHGPLSRTAVARHAGLSPSAVSNVTRDLLRRGVICEVGTQQEGVGRPSIMLSIRSEHAFFLGTSLDREEITGILADLGGTVRSQLVHPVDGTEPAHVVEAIDGMARELLRRATVPLERLTGIGLALSGLVDSRAGVCIQSTVLGWAGVPIASLFRSRFGLPVSVANDADAVAVGERLFGAAQRHENFAVLSIGRGIGAGIFVDGKLHRGAHGASGELGHCTVEPGGPPCRCGKRGCLEAVASVPVVLERLRAQGLAVGSLEEAETRAATGDPIARAELERAGSAIGLALSHLVNLFSPELVIVTGSGSRLGPLLQEAVLKRHAEHVIPMLPRPPRLLFRQENGAVWARGAASLATQAFVQSGGAMAR